MALTHPKGRSAPSEDLALAPIFTLEGNIPRLELPQGELPPEVAYQIIHDELTDLAALRVVVKRGFSHDLADRLIDDLRRQLPRLERQPVPVHVGDGATGFHH